VGVVHVSVVGAGDDGARLERHPVLLEQKTRVAPPPPPPPGGVGPAAAVGAVGVVPAVPAPAPAPAPARPVLRGERARRPRVAPLPREHEEGPPVPDEAPQYLALGGGEGLGGATEDDDGAVGVAAVEGLGDLAEARAGRADAEAGAARGAGGARAGGGGGGGVVVVVGAGAGVAGGSAGAEATNEGAEAAAGGEGLAVGRGEENLPVVGVGAEAGGGDGAAGGVGEGPGGLRAWFEREERVKRMELKELEATTRGGGRRGRLAASWTRTTGAGDPARGRGRRIRGAFGAESTPER